jgi:tRNA (guanine37-N1)-methyltransferase
MFNALTNTGITKYAFAQKLCNLNIFNPRDYTTDPYKRVDDKSFGGGPGMVMKIEPLELAMQDAIKVQAVLGSIKPLRIYLSPQGQRVNQNLVNNLVKQAGIIFVCGRYEGIDERFIQKNIDLEVSIGDFVVSGGEFPAMLLMDALIRQIPGVLNNHESALNDSFMNGLLDYPHYTHPREYNGNNVPEVLLSGDHKEIEKWRLKMSLLRTLERRPDLLEKRKLTPIESGLLEEVQRQLASFKDL